MADAKQTTIGGRTFALAELRLGDLRRVPTLGPALVVMMQFQVAKGSFAFPTTAQLDALSVILFAAASSADPTVQQSDVDAAIGAALINEGFDLIATSASLMGSTATGDPPTGEASSPSTST